MTKALTTAALAAVLLAVPGGTAAATACAKVGATYTARPATPARDVTYRLRIALPPRSDEVSATAEYWTFETVSRRTGAALSALRMVKDCGNGRSPCWVSPPSKPGADEGYYSEVTQLDRDWTPTVHDRAPYAIVLSGFGLERWDFAADHLGADLRYLAEPPVAPNLEDQTVWLLTRCGPPPRRGR